MKIVNCVFECVRMCVDQENKKPEKKTGKYRNKNKTGKGKKKIAEKSIIKRFTREMNCVSFKSDKVC